MDLHQVMLGLKSSWSGTFLDMGWLKGLSHVTVITALNIFVG